MPLRQKYRPENLPPLTPADTEAASKVLETIQSLELDPDELVLVGSAAIALYGLTLRSDRSPIPTPLGQPDIQPEPKLRPGDVDLLATGAFASQLYEQGHLSGHALHVGGHSARIGDAVLRTDSTVPLPVEVIVDKAAARSPLGRYSRKFSAYMDAHSRPIAGLAGGPRVATPYMIREDLYQRSTALDTKATSDLNQFNAHLERHDR